MKKMRAGGNTIQCKRPVLHRLFVKMTVPATLKSSGISIFMWEFSGQPWQRQLLVLDRCHTSSNMKRIRQFLDGPSLKHFSISWVGWFMNFLSCQHKRIRRRTLMAELEGQGSYGDIVQKGTFDA
jgi:hypothetical protein